MIGTALKSTPLENSGYGSIGQAATHMLQSALLGTKIQLLQGENMEAAQ